MTAKYNKILYGVIVFLLFPIAIAFGISESKVIGFTYDYANTMTVTEKWFSCPYTTILNEQSALYKSMEHVNWISIDKITGKGPYCASSDNGEALENPGIVQKIDLWRQRLRTYQEAKNLRPYYDSQATPKNALDDRYDENRMALLDWLFTTRTKMERCVTGYGADYKENLAKIRLFGCQEGVTATSAQGYRIAPDFPYPVNKNSLNCFPLNAEYLTKKEKGFCLANKDLQAGCQAVIGKQSYVDDYYCTFGRQQTSK